MAPNVHRDRRMLFRDRHDARTRLARACDTVAGSSQVVVLALPCDGVPVGFEIAMRLGAALDILVVRALVAPSHPELAIGLVASAGVELVDRRAVHRLGIAPDELARLVRDERAALDRRERTLRGGRPPIAIDDVTVILVADGLDTGATMVGAIAAARARSPARIVGAVPIAPRASCAMLAERADDLICLVAPERTDSLGHWYQDFAPTSDGEVRQLLDAAAHRTRTPFSTAATAP